MDVLTMGGVKMMHTQTADSWLAPAGSDYMLQRNFGLGLRLNSA
jgi:hypothetical protein